MLLVLLNEVPRVTECERFGVMTLSTELHHRDRTISYDICVSPTFCNESLNFMKQQLQKNMTMKSRFDHRLIKLPHNHWKGS